LVGILRQPLKPGALETPFPPCDRVITFHTFYPSTKTLSGDHMKLFGYSLIAISVLLIVVTAIDEIDGSVTVRSPRSRLNAYSIPETYTKKGNPVHFRNAMTYHWLRAPMPAIVGCAILWFIRRQDRLDPSSPHFQGSQALDELGEYLDRELEKKKKSEDDPSNGG
jgi:hypothetical protein